MSVIDKDLKEYHDEFKTRLDSRVGVIYSLKKQIEELTKELNNEVFQYRKELEIFELMGIKLELNYSRKVYQKILENLVQMN